VSEPTYVSVPDVFMTSDASLRLQQKAAVSPDARIVPTQHVAYDVESYYVAGGQPVADTALGIDAGAVVEIGGFSAQGAFEAPWTDDVVSVLAPQSRWLPLEGTFDDGMTWVAHAGDERIDLDSDGTDPELDTAFSYLRGRAFTNGSAMRLDAGDYLLTDGARWAAESVAVAMVVVLRTPMQDTYGVLETYDRDGVDPNRAFVGLRYTSDGVLEVHSRGRLGSIQTTSQGARPNQPIIVAFALSQPAQLDVVVADRAVTRKTLSLGDTHPYDARLYVGRSPGATLGAASMDIIELDYWLGLTGDELLEKVHVLDRLYGVTA
jgi:hypothetical protein